MARIVTLGTAAAVPDETHANTYLAVEGEQGFFLIDCGDNPLLRPQRAGLAPERLRGLIITHFHPDHVCTVPILLMNIWLLGRADPLPVYGLQDVVERFNAMMDLFRWDEWPGLFPIPCHAVPEEVGAVVLEDDDIRIIGAPVEHLVPTMGLRIENKRSGGVVAYSSDTAPCDAVVTLARDADVLIHEAAKNTLGHSSAAQAGEIARRAGARRLVLIHYRPTPRKYDRWIEEATATFGGPVELARDFGEYEF
ncbi:MAG: MBL fold metallo-hydrolase [Chloroflexi bacterium]|nr:MBL fold metallo-hydrolase [Chloroflexota bacterium]